jgi:biofilm PGA synthesis N-glycosyltransferase PgaC
MLSLPKFSVIIPVYRNSTTLEDTLTKLLNDGYPRKELIVSMDMPTQETIAVWERFSSWVTFDVSQERRGKVQSLKQACSIATGDILFFLDSDIRILTDDLLSKVAEELVENEMVELKKTVAKEGAISKLVYFEYVGIGAADWIISRKTGRTFGVNGAAFAIKREAFERVGGFRNVVSEDLDFGLRSFAAGVKFKFCPHLEVVTYAPPSLRGWFRQRKRWAYGTALWAKENRRVLLSVVRSRPSVFLPALFMIFPALIGFFSSFAFRGLAVYDAIALLFLSLPTRGFPVIVVPFLSFQVASDLLVFGLTLLVGLSAYGGVYYYYARRLMYSFSPHWFIIYYMVYSPAWLAAMIWGIAQVFVRRESVQLDWKV